jgi:hypothetical protein
MRAINRKKCLPPILFSPLVLAGALTGASTFAASLRSQRTIFRERPVCCVD